MTLTVRLDDTLAQALERHCAATGATKSLVVQESLAVYLLAHRSPHRGQAAARGVAPSANARAFAEAGLLGAAALGAGPADKAAVRAQARRRLQPKAG